MITFYFLYRVILKFFSAYKESQKLKRKELMIIAIQLILSALGIIGFILILNPARSPVTPDRLLGILSTVFPFLLGFGVYKAFYFTPTKYARYISIIIVATFVALYAHETATKYWSSKYWTARPCLFKL
jgi:hypothetical protein